MLVITPKIKANINLSDLVGNTEIGATKILSKPVESTIKNGDNKTTLYTYQVDPVEITGADGKTITKSTLTSLNEYKVDEIVPVTERSKVVVNLDGTKTTKSYIQLG